MKMKKLGENGNGENPDNLPVMTDEEWNALPREEKKK